MLRALELRYPGFGEKLETNLLEEALAPTVVEDVPLLFWTAASWLGAFSTDTFDMELLLSLPKPIAVLNRALELDESFSNGMIHDTLISIYGSLPQAMGGSQDKARYHFDKAVEHSAGLSPSPYVALASTQAYLLQHFTSTLALRFLIHHPADTPLTHSLPKIHEVAHGDQDQSSQILHAGSTKEVLVLVSSL